MDLLEKDLLGVLKKEVYEPKLVCFCKNFFYVHLQILH